MSMTLLASCGVDVVHHYTPLHYLVFIARGGALQGKPSLLKQGFNENHFRSKSRQQDVKRGFGAYAHLTIEKNPSILRAKLERGFPHIGFFLHPDVIDQNAYSLCRYNVAMTRILRRDGKPGRPESASNGRYYPSHEIPIARADADKREMLETHLPLGTMIEVLMHKDLVLPDSTSIICYSAEDAAVAQSILETFGRPWRIELQDAPTTYNASSQHVEDVNSFIAQAIADPSWKGNGLEFDRL